MGEKRFRTRRQWHNTLLAVWATPFAMLIGIFYGVSTGNFLPLWILMVLLLVGFTVGILRDRISRSTYHVINDRIVLVRGNVRLELRSEDIIDASLIDRSGARDHIKLRSGAPTKDGRSERETQDSFLRFCTIDIGLRTYTFGLGRGMIDRMPNARHDMVLLRMRTGGDILLSPEYNQELVDVIGRILRRLDDNATADRPQL